MRQKLFDIVSDFFKPLQNFGVVFLALAALIVGLWIIMAIVRLAIG